MKKFVLIASLMAACSICGCNKIEPLSDKENDKEQECKVSINLLGDITTSETEMTKSTSPTNNLYGVQVYQDGKKFALGIFDDVSCMNINMKSGHVYLVKVCMIKDAKSLVSCYSLANGGVQLNYQGPFLMSEISRLDELYYMPGYIKSNTFFYYSNHFFQYYKNSTSTEMQTASIRSDSSYEKKKGYFELDQLGVGSLNGVDYPTCVDWFYGEKGEYVPQGEFGQMDIPLKRTGFKLKYELSGVTDGQVTVKINNGTRTFIETTTTTESYSSDTQFIAFKDAYSAWKYADNYTENMDVTVTWVRGIGITQNLGTKTVQIKRNCLNNIKIKLGSDDRGAGVSLNAEAESSMGSAENNIPVE